MCYQNSVVDRATETEQGGGPDVPGTDHTSITQRISQLPDDALKRAVIESQRLIDRTTAEQACLVSELDARQLTDIDDALSTTQWLRHFCRMTAMQASGTAKTARALDHMPAIMAVALDGQVPHRSLHLLAQARDRHPEEFPEREATFAEDATQLSVRDLRQAVSRWDQHVDYERALDDAEYDAERRELFFNQMGHGRWDCQGAFGVADGHVINTALRGFIQHTYTDEDDRRSMPQRLADAEVAIHRHWLDHNDSVLTSGGEKPHITVTVPYEILTGSMHQLPELDGHAVDPETVRRWACDAGIVRIVTNGDSQPLDVGRRTRTIPGSLRRAIERRDGGCTWEGCRAPVSWCDVHHIIHWADGGDTSLENCKLLCRKHHTRTHKQKVAPPPTQRPPPGAVTAQGSPMDRWIWPPGHLDSVPGYSTVGDS